MNLPLFEPTYSVSRLGAEIQELLAEAYPSIWVVGEVQRLRPSQRGHLYFELVEKGERDEIVGKLDAVAWRGDWQKIRTLLSRHGQELAEGQQIRCRVGVDFYPPGGRLQLVVREIDPVFTAGLLAQRRRETLEALTAAGLLERNRALLLPPLPLRLGLVTSEGSAAYHDFLSGLRESGYGFTVVFVHAAVQGREAEREVASALVLLQSSAIDCAVVVRGGGSRTDLAAFDSRAIAEAVARAPFPVVTGLGHEIDQSIADLVAHTAVKTPTKAAEFVVGRVREADRRTAELAAALSRSGLERLRQGREALGRAERGVALARLRLRNGALRLAGLARSLARAAEGRLRSTGSRVQELAERLERSAPRTLTHIRRATESAGRSLVSAARGRLATAHANLQGMARLCEEISPQRTLRRGFSVTRTESGALLRQPAQVHAGERITTETSGGLVASRVEER